MKPLRSTDNRDAGDVEAFLLARIDALEMKVCQLASERPIGAQMKDQSYITVTDNMKAAGALILCDVAQRSNIRLSQEYMEHIVETIFHAMDMVRPR